MQKTTERRLDVRVLAGFLLSGAIFALLGSMLPAWGFDVDPRVEVAGRHFLALAVGIVAGHAAAVRNTWWRPGIRLLLVAGCGLVIAGFVELALAPSSLAWRFAGLGIAGAGAGLVHTGLFAALGASYSARPAAVLNVAGIFFGTGSVFCALLVGGAFFSLPPGTIFLLLAGMPAVLFLLYLRMPFPAPGIASHPKVLAQFRSVPAILFSLVLLFQFGNEWSLVGWLPLLLVHRLGLSPATALKFLAFYFAALTLARVGMNYLLPRMSAWRLLGASVSASLLGCGALAYTNNAFGAGVSIAMIGIGFAAIYPIVASFTGRKFPYYHPGYFNGIFSFALVGGLLAPWMLGEFAARFGMAAIITIPVIGTCLVVAVLFLIWMQGKVTGE